MKSLVLALSAAVLFSGAAFADQAVQQKSVTFADLNLGSKEGITQLHNRLVAAANEVCADTKDATGAPYFEECRAKAVRQAIAEVGEKVSKRLATVQ
jgi:UrcA family protein